MIARLVPALLSASLLLIGAAQAQTAATPKTTKTMHYDCSKAGNANKAACKSAAAAPAATSAAVAAPAATTTMHSTATSSTTMKGGDKPTHAGGPNGATAQCRDGTYSKSAHHSGTCSGHKGVATWY